MIATSDHPYLTPQQYLQLEEKSPIKHEYIDGQIYAMVGANDAHVTITGNLFTLLRNHVRSGGCRVYFTDMKLRIASLNRYFYPDIFVTCDPSDRETPLEKRCPRLIVEVLSDSTEAFDRGDKFADYQSIDSLEEYVLVNSKRKRVECFRRNQVGLWLLQTYTDKNTDKNTGQDSTFRLESLEFVGSIEDLYEDVQL